MPKVTQLVEGGGRWRWDRAVIQSQVHVGIKTGRELREGPEPLMVGKSHSRGPVVSCGFPPPKSEGPGSSGGK